MNVKLKTLSPLHIGGREGVIYPLEYLTFGQRCYVINEGRLSQRLYTLGKLDVFLENVKQLSERFDIRSFLHSEALLEEELLEEISNYSNRCSVNIRRGLRPFIRNGFSQPFVPGSSIKGVLRTSILYVILKRLDDSVRKRLLHDFVKRRLEEYKKDPRGQKGYRWFQERFKQWFAQRLDQDIFQRFTLRSDQRRYDAHTDILRYLKVSDSSPIDKDSLMVEEIKIYSAYSDESPKRWSIFAECVPAGIEFEFELKADEGILADFAKTNRSTKFGVSFSDLTDILSKPLDTAGEMASDLLREEKEFFDRELQMGEAMDFGPETPNFRIGWGAGLLGTSMGMLLPKEIRQDLRNTLFRDCRNTPAPKSRRVVVGNSFPRASLGWAIAY